MFKIIILAILLYLLYKALGGEFKLPQKKSSRSREEDENTLVECKKCGIYITEKEAIKKSGSFYCQECYKE